jgi:hypothetical protein
MDLTPFDGVFNLTATYMPESDVYMPYNAYTARRNSGEFDPLTRVNTTRPNLVLWYVSNCHTTQTQWRQRYALELEKHVKIHTFGQCGHPDPCENTANSDDRRSCAQHTMQGYKFYLAFENSLCRHYISEKFWDALKYGIVPIVLGSPQEDVERAAPPDSFLHVDNFTSPAELADYLLYLDSHPLAYNKYYKWRERFEIAIPFAESKTCKLCEMAHRNEAERKSYNISQWYSSDALCTLT